MNNTQKNCRHCNGTGKIACTTCNGSGVTTKLDSSCTVVLGGITIPESKTCIKCNGTRKIPCPYCNGSGKFKY